MLLPVACVAAPLYLLSLSSFLFTSAPFFLYIYSPVFPFRGTNASFT